MKVEISNGELVDKVTILQIKSEKIKDTAKLANVRKELGDLTPLVEELGMGPGTEEYKALYIVNSKLWVIEDRIREKEALGEFDSEFVSLARSVYITNDSRADLKRIINDKTNSTYVEEKDYKDIYK